MSAPSGWTCTSPMENSTTCALFHCSSHPARSNIAPLAVTPTNVGERWLWTLSQSFFWMDCHIRRSFCSAPVAFFQVGCFGSPAQPASRKQTTKDTKKHKGRINRNLVSRELNMQSCANRGKHNKKGTKLNPLCPSCPLWLKPNSSRRRLLPSSLQPWERRVR